MRSARRFCIIAWLSATVTSVAPPAKAPSMAALTSCSISSRAAA
jgi:hypothetical protein